MNYINDQCLTVYYTSHKNKDALSYHNVRGLYFTAVIFVGTIVSLCSDQRKVTQLSGTI